MQVELMRSAYSEICVELRERAQRQSGHRSSDPHFEAQAWGWDSTWTLEVDEVALVKRVDDRGNYRLATDGDIRIFRIGSQWYAQHGLLSDETLAGLRRTEGTQLYATSRYRGV